MSAAFALFLLAQSTACPPGAPAPLAGGATIVRPVGKADPVPFEQLGPVTGLSKPDTIHRTAADNEGDGPNVEAPSDICESHRVTIA